MQPTSFNLRAQARDGFESRGAHQAQDAPGVIRALSGARRPRSHESWIEVSSQPSSSSLSSATDEIVTTGLRVHHDSNHRRRRRIRSLAPTHVDISDQPTSAGGSSQEEYEESESESDRVMNSSTEGLQPSGYHQESHPSGPPSSASEEASSEISEDDDGNSTALGITNNQQEVFTPQPNAFSHPPHSTHTHPSSVPNSYFPAQRAAPTRSTRHSYPTQRPRSHTPYTLISPSHTLDHDAALRASLSTLLSCAAAARALPKRDHHPPSTTPGPSSRIEPSTLRLIPESALLAPPASSSPPLPRARSPTSTPSGKDRHKRKASTSKDRRSKRRASASGASGVDEALSISPTLMTWVVSAGVVVLFSAISFSAGYAIGREVGRVEATGGAWGGEGLDLRQGRGEVGEGLRKLRWAPTRTVGGVV